MDFKEDFICTKENINIFIVSLNKFKIFTPELYLYLSYNEQMRANKFCTNHLKNCYITSHGLLKVLLARYLSLSPFQIKYSFNDYHKPFCQNNPSLYFNMSHCNDYVCYAFSYYHEIGIDIEHINTRISINNYLHSTITETESITFNDLLEADKYFHFYKLWTLKEAFLKALGTGLSYPPLQVETAVLPKNLFKITKTSCLSDKELIENWSFAAIRSIPDHVGAIAVKKKDALLTYIFLTPLNSF